MNSQDYRIMKLLKQGKTYAEIQEIEQVSPNRIAMVKKMMDAMDSSDDALLDTIMDDISDDSDTIFDDSYITSHDRNDISSDSFHPDEISSEKKSELQSFGLHTRPPTDGELELERLKIELDHEERMEKLRIKNRVLAQHETGLRIKQNGVDREEQKKEGLKKVLMSRFSKLLKRCGEGKWSDSEVEDFLDDVDALIRDFEEYGLLYHVDTEDWEEVITLQEIQNFFQKIWNDMNEDEEKEIRFNYTMRKCLEKWE